MLHCLLCSDFRVFTMVIKMELNISSLWKHWEVGGYRVILDILSSSVTMWRKFHFLSSLRFLHAFILIPFTKICFFLERLFQQTLWNYTVGGKQRDSSNVYSSIIDGPWTDSRRGSVQFSHSVMSDSLRPHESQHARPPCPSPTPGFHPDSRPSSQ